ncbi:hypothetical protein VaNZ11_011649, partial [Volvox africanus]
QHRKLRHLSGMRKRALRLLLLGSQGRFWRHALHYPCKTGQQNLHPSRHHGAAGEIATSLSAEDAAALSSPIIRPLPRPPTQQQPQLAGSYVRDPTITVNIAAAIPASLGSPRTTQNLRPPASLFLCGSPCHSASSLAKDSGSLDGATSPPPAAMATSTAPVATQIRRRSCSVQIAGAAATAAAAGSRRVFSSAGPRSVSRERGRSRVQAAAVDSSAAGRRPGGAPNDLHSLKPCEGRAKPNRGGAAELWPSRCVRTAAATTVPTPGLSVGLPSIARGGPCAVSLPGRLVYQSGSLRSQLSDVLTAARQATRSRSMHLRHRAAAQLLAWLCQKPHVSETMAAATSVGVLASAFGPSPASTASELAALCCELSIVDKAVWDRLLDVVAGNAAAVVVTEGCPARIIAGHGQADAAVTEIVTATATVTSGESFDSNQLAEREQRRAGILLAWEYALLLRAAAACGRHVTDHPQLDVLQQALSTLTHRCLLPAPLGGRVVPAGMNIPRQDPWYTSESGGEAVEEGQRPDGVHGLATLLHAGGELTALSEGTKQVALSLATPVAATATAAVAAQSRAILLQAGVAEAALQELLLTVAQAPSSFAGGILSNTTLGAAASLRAVLVAWRLLADGALRTSAVAAGPSEPSTTTTTPVAVNTAAVVANKPPPSTIGIDLELIQQVASFLEASANFLLPEARHDFATDTEGGNVSGGSGSGSSSSSSSNARIIQQLALAWRSGPDLHRHPGLSKAVWDALPVTAALAMPSVPWVAAELTAAPGGSGNLEIHDMSAFSTSSSGSIPAHAPAPPPAGAIRLLLSELCRLAAATFYHRNDSLYLDAAAKPGLSGNISTRRRSSSGSSSSSNSSSTTSDSYSPNADNLLMLVRVVEALRGHTAAAGSVDRTPAGAASVPTAGESLEAIVLASSSAYLRRVTRLISWEGRRPAGPSIGREDEEDMLGLPVSALLTEYLARRSRIPDWHLMWRLLRHHNAAVAVATATAAPVSLLQPPPHAERGNPAAVADPDYSPDTAAWAAHATSAVAARVLHSSDEELRRWCWPRTAVRVAEMLAESLRLRGPEASADEGGTASCAGGGAPLPATAAAAAAERLLLHAASTVLGAPKPELNAALAWLRSAVVLGGVRRWHGDGSGASRPFPVVLGDMAALAEVLLVQFKQQQLQHQGAAAIALDWALDTLPYSHNSSESQISNGGSGSATTTSISTATHGGSSLEPLTASGCGHEGRAGAGPGTGSGASTAVQAIGELLEVDARELEHQLSLSLLEGALEALVSTAKAAAADAEWRKRLSPLDGPPPASAGEGSAGGAAGEVLARAAVHALSWLARRQVLPGPELLGPLLKAATAPPAEWQSQGARPGKAVPETAKAGLRKEPQEGCIQQQQQQQQQQVPEATLAVASLVELAGAEEGRPDVVPQLRDAARQLAATLQRAPPERLPLLQLAALCGALWRLGLMDPSLLLHLTQLQRRPHVARYNMTKNEGGGGGHSSAASAVAASQLLQLAATVLCPPSPPRTHLHTRGSGSAILGYITTTAAAAAAATTSATASAASLSGGQLAEVSDGLGSWLLPILSRGVEAVPPEQLVAVWSSARELAAACDGVVNGAVGTAALGGGGTGDGDGVRPNGSSQGWLQTLDAVATRRFLTMGVDGMLLHQLATLSRCIAGTMTSVKQPPTLHSDLSRRDYGKCPSTSELRSEAIETTPSATTTPRFLISHPDAQQTAGWLSRWLQPQPQCPPRPTHVSSSPEEGDGLLHRIEDRIDGAALPVEVAVLAPTGLDVLSRGSAVQLTPLVEELHQQRQQQQQQLHSLQQQVMEALLQRTTRHGDSYEAPADVACGALHDLAVAGVLRTSQPLAASLIEGLVFRLADDAGIDGLCAVTAALAAGGADPWVGHCAARGLLDELATGLQRRLRLEPEQATTAHLVAMAANMFHVATAPIGGRAAAATAAATQPQVGIAATAAASAGAWLSSAAILRVLSRALASRAEQLLPDQALSVAAMFSPPRLRDAHLLQRLTEAAATAVVTVPPSSVAAAAAAAVAPELQRVYTAEQLLRLAQCLYSAGIREQHLFAPLARALRVMTDASAAGAGSDDVNARTLQAAAALFRAVRLHVDAEALQQAFVLRIRAGGNPRT